MGKVVKVEDDENYQPVEIDSSDSEKEVEYMLDLVIDQNKPSKTSFAVIHFLETDEITVVSTAWLVESSSCKWPPCQNMVQLKRCILEHKIPEPSWVEHEVVVLGIYSNYATAKKKVELSLDTSNVSVESSTVDCVKIVGKKRRKPQIPVEVYDVSEIEMSPRKKKKNSNIIPSTSVCRQDHTNDPATFVSDSDIHNHSESRKEPQSESLKVQQMISMLQDMRATLHTHTVMLQRLLPTFHLPETMVSFPPHPIKNDLELQQWEDFLKDTENFRECVKYFFCHVGPSYSKSVRHIMKDLISPSYASEYNWAGRGIKKPFKELKLASLVWNCIKEHPLTKATPVLEVQNIIKGWLKIYGYMSRKHTEGIH